jgi:CRP/FNR family transcriptional regulator, cyclic AMP receptor protein
VAFFDYPDGSAETAADKAAFLVDASDDDWAAIRAHAELRHFTPGELVMAADEVDRALSIVVDGTLEVSITEGRRGRARRLATIEPGTVIGEVSFFDGRPRSASVRALTDVRVLRLSYESFEVLAAKEPALGRRILLDIGRVMALRLRDVERML